MFNKQIVFIWHQCRRDSVDTLILSDRLFTVHVNGKVSSEKPVLSGIPQGSILGPILFVIYINDLPDDCASLSDIFMYADDAKLYKYIYDVNDVHMLHNS